MLKRTSGGFLKTKSSSDGFVFCFMRSGNSSFREPEGRQRRHSTPRPVQSKPGTLSGTRPSAIAEFSL